MARHARGLIMLSSVTKGSKLPRRTEKDSARLKEVVTRSSKGAGPAHRPNLKTSVVDRRDEVSIFGTEKLAELIGN